MPRTVALALLSISGLLAQTPAPSPPPAGPVALEYAGKPLKIPFACGEDDIQSFGMTCTADEPCAVYLELSGIEAVNTRLFVSGNLHSASATLFSILLSSEDGGKTWTEAFDRIRGAALEGIQFHDFASGWIAGVSIQALPRDPFFLLTTDGGKTWRNRPIYGESRVGAIDTYFFDSKNHGSLIVTVNKSHELLETQTGGENWTMRQVSQSPLSLKQIHRPEAEWRLRADSKSKAFRVERKQGPHWTDAASFSLDAGDCRPKETVLTEPPPEPATTPASEPKVVGPDGAVAEIVVQSGDKPKKPVRKKK